MKYESSVAKLFNVSSLEIRFGFDVELKLPVQIKILKGVAF